MLGQQPSLFSDQERALAQLFLCAARINKKEWGTLRMPQGSSFLLTFSFSMQVIRWSSDTKLGEQSEFSTESGDCLLRAGAVSPHGWVAVTEPTKILIYAAYLKPTYSFLNKCLFCIHC